MTSPNQLEQLILDTLQERGELTAGQLSKAARVAPAVLHPALGPLVTSGKVLKLTATTYPNGVTYRLPK